MVSAAVVTCRTNQSTAVPAMYLTLSVYHFVERLLTDSLSLTGSLVSDILVGV